MKNAGDVVDLAIQLMQCPSITPDDAGCQEIISQRLKQIDFKCESLQYEDVDNLWARRGTASPTLVFAGHTDVVPTGPLDKWQSPPFSPEIRDGYLYGRGAADMKAAIAAMIIAVEKFIQQKPNFKGSIAFLITSDEEGPSINGTQKVMQTLVNRQETFDYCIIGEPSSDKQVGDQVRIGRRGSLSATLSVQGKQGHVAHPHLAINPIHKSMLPLHELTQAEWDQGNSDFPPTTFQISNIQSGTGAVNVIPGNLEAKFNFRYSTAVTVEKIKQRVEKILNDNGLKFAIDWHTGAMPFLTKKGGLVSHTQQAIKNITGLDPKLSTGGGTSDGRYIAPLGIEVVELGVSNATAHHVNECVKVQDLESLVEIYLGILNLIFE